MPPTPQSRHLAPAAAETARQQAALAALRAELTAMGVAAQDQGKVLAEAMKQERAETERAAQALSKLRQEEAAATAEAVKLAAAHAALAAANARAFGDSVRAGVAGLSGAVEKATLVVGGLATAGLHASVMGQLLQDQTARLAATVGGLFRPEIEKAVETVGKLTDWVNGLSDGQREMIARVLEGVAAFVAVNRVLPVLTGLIGPLIAGVKALGVAITSGLASTGIGALLPLLGLAAGALAAFFAGTETGRGMLASLSEAFEPVAEAFGELVQAAQPLFDALSRVAAQLAGALAGALTALIPLFTKAVAAAGPAFAQLGKVVDALAAAFGAIGEAIGSASEQFGALFQGVGEYLEESIGYFKELIEIIAEVVVAMKPLVAVFAQAFINALRAVVWTLTKMVQYLTWVLKLLRATLETVGLASAYAAREEHGAAKKPEEKKKDKDRSPFELKVGGPEGIEETWKRIAKASARVGAGKPVAEQQLDVEKRMELLLQAIHVAVGNQRPALVK